MKRRDVHGCWCGPLCSLLLLACGSVSGQTTDASSGSGDQDAMGSGSAATCTAGEALSCANDTLVRCGTDGITHESIACQLGCHATEVRCNDVDPSNSLASYLDQTAGKPTLDLGSSATIDTTTGQVNVDGNAVQIASFVVGNAPQVRVFVVGSLVANDVSVSGTNALAIVADGELRVSGHLSLSAKSYDRPGPGSLSSLPCEGKPTGVGNSAYSGAGGGGFGTAGARGGTVNNTATSNVQTGGAGGGTIGNTTLTPLRGGCDSGLFSGSVRGRGGGAVQLVSRTKILVEGIISANGSSSAGGGSGGGILLEAPAVVISGNVVANGGAGAAGGFAPKAGEDGRTDSTPATGATATDPASSGNGGNGAAGATGATAGQDKTVNGIVFGGHGGGGVGRIRINTTATGLTTTGIVSPNPSIGMISVR